MDIVTACQLADLHFLVNEIIQGHKSGKVLLGHSTIGRTAILQAQELLRTLVEEDQSSSVGPEVPPQGTAEYHMFVWLIMAQRADQKHSKLRSQSADL